MKTFTEKLQQLELLESDIVDLKNYKVTVPFEIDAMTFYTYLKRVWYTKHDTYLKFPFPIGSYIENDNRFTIFLNKPWNLVGEELLKASYVKPVGE